MFCISFSSRFGGRAGARDRRRETNFSERIWKTGRLQTWRRGGIDFSAAVGKIGRNKSEREGTIGETVPQRSQNRRSYNTARVFRARISDCYHHGTELSGGQVGLLRERVARRRSGGRRRRRGGRGGTLSLSLERFSSRGYAAERGRTGGLGRLGMTRELESVLYFAITKERSFHGHSREWGMFTKRTQISRVHHGTRPDRVCMELTEGERKAGLPQLAIR